MNVQGHAVRFHLETADAAFDLDASAGRLLFDDAVVVAHDDREGFGRPFMGAARLEGRALFRRKTAARHLPGLAGGQAGNDPEQQDRGDRAHNAVEPIHRSNSCLGYIIVFNKLSLQGPDANPCRAGACVRLAPAMSTIAVRGSSLGVKSGGLPSRILWPVPRKGYPAAFQFRSRKEPGIDGFRSEARHLDTGAAGADDRGWWPHRKRPGKPAEAALGQGCLLAWARRRVRQAWGPCLILSIGGGRGA